MVYRARLVLTLVSIRSRAFGSCKLTFSSDDSTSDSTGTCSCTKLHTQYTKATTPQMYIQLYGIANMQCTYTLTHESRKHTRGKFSPLNALVSMGSIIQLYDCMIILLIHVQLLCNLSTHCQWQQEEWRSAFLHCVLP